MRIPSLILALICCSFYYTFGQQISDLDYKWDADPKLHTIDSADINDGELVLMYKRTIEFAYNDKGQLTCYQLTHKTIRVNSDEAIESNNKIYVPSDDDKRIIEHKARVITSTGKVMELNKDDIKEAVDEESDQTYHYYALEGIDKGSEIEYFTLAEIAPVISGKNISFQTGTKRRDVSFHLISPDNLIFKTKSYNELPELEADTTIEDVNILKFHIDKIPALKSEEFANYNAHRMSLEFKLEKNTYTRSNEIFRFGSAAENAYTSVYGELDKSTMKKVNKLIKNIELNEADDEETKIRKIENYLKSRFSTINMYAPELKNVSSIIDNKVANENGMTKLFAAVLTARDIKHQIILTSNRYKQKFDPDFESYGFLSEYLIYIPSIGEYIAPTEKFFRLGYIPSNLTHNYGLFIKPVQLGDYKTGVGKVKFIEGYAADKTLDNMDIKVDFGNNFDKLTIDMKREQTGYYAQPIQTVYDYLDEEQKKEINEETMVKFITENMEIEEVNLKNASADDFGTKPLITEAKYSSKEFIEKAGPKFLFKIGKLIGPQAELYMEEERKLEVENRFNRSYTRVIEFDVPEGYKCINLDDLNMDVFRKDEEPKTMTFTSTYTKEGNSIRVEVIEYYTQIIWPLEMFEDYRNVINAAANFNKIVLIFEKK